MCDPWELTLTLGGAAEVARVGGQWFAQGPLMDSYVLSARWYP
jgi:hypothetical protein